MHTIVLCAVSFPVEFNTDPPPLSILYALTWNSTRKNTMHTPLFSQPGVYTNATAIGRVIFSSIAPSNRICEFEL